ncbi:hypothetical protein R6Q57_021750 [Mikania cordata]
MVTMEVKVDEMASERRCESARIGKLPLLVAISVYKKVEIATTSGNLFTIQIEENGEKGPSTSPPDKQCRHFSLAEIKSATNDFDDAFVIGKGGFGKVYKGKIDVGPSTDVAIKRLNLDSNQGASEFWAEIEMLSKFRHSHIVSLFGYCEKQMILVYEYMPNGSLEDHLHKKRANGSNSSSLTWIQRLNICIGAARGLDYLHTGTGVQCRVIHRDVKSSNVLLDNNLTAKISDFGLSRIGPACQPGSTTNVYTDQIKGTFGYMDAEYFSTRRLTRKSDVYAYGHMSPNTKKLGQSIVNKKKSFMMAENGSGQQLKIFTFSELKTATKNFSQKMFLGEGGYGKVYVGWLDSLTLAPQKDGDGLAVAIKKSSPNRTQGLNEWQDFNAKLSDFGLAKVGPVDGESHVSTGIAGTYGYMAPEYVATG